MSILFGQENELTIVSFGDLDLIFKVMMRHKRKYLNKIMTVCAKPMDFVWIYTNIFYGQDNEFIGDLEMPNANLCLKYSMLTVMPVYDL